MYRPVNPRQTKTIIRRSRQGCAPCHRKRRKCDECKPQCNRCVTDGDICLLPAAVFKFRDARSWAEKKVEQVRGDRLILRQYTSSHEEPSSNLTWRDLSNGDRYYLHHFITAIVAILPKQLQVLQCHFQADEMALSAAKALAAAHLAVCRGAFASNLQWAPAREERQDAFQHTARTLKLMVASGSHALPGLIATHLMLCLVEMSLGTKHGLQRYSSSIDNLVFRHSSQLEATENGQRLLQAAYDTQATSRLFAGPWRFTHEPRSMERYLLLCAARDNARDPNALLSALVGQFWQALAPQDMVDALGDLTDAQLSTACEEAIKTLQSLAETIHGIPPPPMDREFPTHEATLDAARYAQCCILCDVALLRDLVTRAPPSCKEPNRWLRIMLDIANSLDISRSATQDLWGCSLVTMLARGAVRCSAPQGFAAVETYMDKIASTGVSWVDTGFSTDVIRPHFATLRDQVERGRKVIITAPSSSSYSEQNPTLDARLGTEWYIYGVESDGRRFVEEVQSIQ